MQLRHASRAFSGAIALALAFNLGVLLYSGSTQRETDRAVDRRQEAFAAVAELVSGVDLLASMVQGYATTGQTRYLTLYYDILAVWQGEAAAPVAHNLAAHWREQLSRGEPAAAPRTGPRRSMLEHLRALEFAPDELHAAQKVMDSTAALQQIEKIAFAATQGLYDPATQRFVDEGSPDRGHAIELVHSPQYEARRWALVQAVGELSEAVDRRTAQDLRQARQRQHAVVMLAVLCNLLFVPLLAWSMISLRRRVLAPIQRLVDARPDQPAPRDTSVQLWTLSYGFAF